MQPLPYTAEMDAEFKENERRAKISKSLKRYHRKKKRDKSNSNTMDSVLVRDSVTSKKA